MIEGGAETLNYWLKANLWDEARVFHAPISLDAGISAPTIDQKELRQEIIGNDTLYFYSNNH